jgi:hypothetical protein
MRFATGSASVSVRLSFKLGRGDTLWSSFLASDIVTHVKLSEIGFDHPNGIQPFLPIEVKAVVPTARYSQPKERPHRRALERDKIIRSDLESRCTTII